MSLRCWAETGPSTASTIREMLLGFSYNPTCGVGRILDYDIRALTPEARARIGYLTGEHLRSTTG